MTLHCPTTPRFKGDLVGCGSINLSDPDWEGYYDCGDCGLFFLAEAGEGDDSGQEKSKEEREEEEDEQQEESQGQEEGQQEEEGRTGQQDLDPAGDRGSRQAD
jgi:hypothetical protein